MDERLRRLERAAALGEPGAAARLAQWRCGLEGCCKWRILSARRWYNYEVCGTMILLKLSWEEGLGDLQIIFRDRDLVTKTVNQTIEQLYYELDIGLCKCPRCGERSPEHKELAIRYIDKIMVDLKGWIIR